MPEIKLSCRVCDKEFLGDIFPSLEYLTNTAIKSLRKMVILQRESELIAALVAHHNGTRNPQGIRGHKYYKAVIDGGKLTGVIQVSGGGESGFVPGTFDEPVVSLILDEIVDEVE